MSLNRGFLFAVLVVVAAAGNASAATYIVGDGLGWTVPPNPTAYATWASRHVFRVGDVLVFNYPTGFHDVAHVTKAAYGGCSSNNPIALVTAGPSNFTLSAVGEDHYICTFGTHCSVGQKLAINVTATTPAPSMPPSTTPAPTMPPSTTPTPTMPPSTTPSPTITPTMSPSPSSSPSPSGGPSMSPPGGMAPNSPMPGVSATPPAPASESTPDGGAGTPPAPSSATIASFCAPLIVFASVVFALVI